MPACCCDPVGACCHPDRCSPVAGAAAGWSSCSGCHCRWGGWARVPGADAGSGDPIGTRCRAAAGCRAWPACAAAGGTRSCCCRCSRGADGGGRDGRRAGERAETPSRRVRGGRRALSRAPCRRSECCPGCGCCRGPARQIRPGSRAVVLAGTGSGDARRHHHIPTGLMGHHHPYPHLYHPSLHLPHHTTPLSIYAADSIPTALSLPFLSRRHCCSRHGSCRTSCHHAAPAPSPPTSAVTATVTSAFASTSALAPDTAGWAAACAARGGSRCVGQAPHLPRLHSL